MAKVRFYQGTKEKYNAEEYWDDVYFAIDEEEILLNGDSYSKYPEWNFIKPTLLETVALSSDSTNYRAATRFYNTAIVIIDSLDIKVYVQNHLDDIDYPFPIVDNKYFKIGEIIPAYTPIIIESTSVDRVDIYSVNSDLPPVESKCTYGTTEGCMTYAVGDEERSNNYVYYKLSFNEDETLIKWYFGNEGGSVYNASANRCWAYVPRFWFLNSNSEAFNVIKANTEAVVNIYGECKTKITVNPDKITNDSDLYSYIKIYKDNNNVTNDWNLKYDDCIELSITDLQAGEYKIEVDADIMQAYDVYNELIEFNFTAEA